MLEPSYLGNIPNNIEELFKGLETFILTDISRRLKKTGQITSTAQWQAQQANLYGIKNIESKIASILKLSQEQTEALFQEVAATSMATERTIYENAKLTMIDFKTEPIQNFIKSAIRQTKGDIENITQSMGFAEVQNGHVVYNDIAKFYHKELNLANLKIRSGVQDYNSAIKQAIRKIADSGVRHINYDSGRSINIDSGVRRAVLTSVHQMNQDMINHCMDELIEPQNQYAEVSAHGNPRPSHSIWQGKVFKVNGSDKDHANLAEATGLGTVSGLQGAGCRHSYFVFIPGASVRAYTDEQLKHLDTPNFNYKGKEYTGYEATQYQRTIENEIRKLKREKIMYTETGLDADAKITNSKITMLRKEYKEFSNASSISEKKNRTLI